MTTQEFNRLMGFEYAKRNRPTTSFVGRSIAKGRGRGYGQVLKGSYVKHTVHIEKVFKST